MFSFIRKGDYQGRIDELAAAKYELEQDLQDHEAGLMIVLAEIADAKARMRREFNA
jgi:hypothetical protein